MKRGQAAVEFMMTYGWAIMGVLGVIAALAYFGFINTDIFTPDKCYLGPRITCVDYSISSFTPVSARLDVKAINGLDTTISPTIFSSSSIAPSTSVAFQCVSAVPGNVMWPPGTTYTLSCGIPIAAYNSISKNHKYHIYLNLTYYIPFTGNFPIDSTGKTFTYTSELYTKPNP